MLQKSKPATLQVVCVFFPPLFRILAQIISLVMSRAQGRRDKYLCCGIFKASTLVMEVIMREYICKPEYHLRSFIRAMRCLTPQPPASLLRGCTSLTGKMASVQCPRKLTRARLNPWRALACSCSHYLFTSGLLSFFFFSPSAVY